MDNTLVIFYLVCFASASGLFMTIKRRREAGRAWLFIFLFILALSVAGHLLQRSSLVYAALATWLVLVVLPGVLAKLYYRSLFQQRYSTARRLAWLIARLHPVEGWRTQPNILRALELAQQGQMDAALQLLHQYQRAGSLFGLAAVTQTYRLTCRWEEFLAWEAPFHQIFEGHPQLLHILLRAYGETGNLNELVDLFARHQDRISKLAPPEARDTCRLMLFAFCGRRDLVERLFRGSLALFPLSTREFWLATADFAAGRTEPARVQLERLLPAADPPMRLALERRLRQLTQPPPSPSPAAQQTIQSVALEYGHDEAFGARPTLFSPRARATQLLISLNVLVFLVEVWTGSSTDSDNLYRLGALFPPAVRAGQWWRLLASLFLHGGPLHLAMNMLGLWLLAPFVELAFGFGKFLLLYLVAGVGSMAFVMTFASGPRGEQMTVGASGAVMGLVGVTGALMLRGWLRQKAALARQRLTAVLLILVTQTTFDALVPQVSMAGHLSGALIGFTVAFLLQDRLLPTPGDEPQRS